MDLQINSSRRSGRPMGISGKVFASVFCFLFVAFGLFGTWMLGRQVVDSLRTRSWTPTDCTIVHRSITETKPYTAEIEYTYPCCGQLYHGTLISRDYHGSDDFYDAQQILDAYPARKGSICRVNPAIPAEAVLRVPSRWTVLTIPLPLIFTIIGGIILWAIWLAPQTTAPAVRRSRLIPAIVCGGLFISGLVMLGVLVPTVQRYRAARRWPSVPCTILHADVQSHSDNDDGTTYSIEVLYRYRVNNRVYRSSRYALTHSSSSGYDGKKQVVDRLNQHRKQVCYVNPGDPADAVLDRDSSAGTIILGGVGGTFFLVGSAGMFGLMRYAKRQHQLKLEEHLPPSRRGPAELHPQMPRWGQLMAVGVFALFWNGIVSVFIVMDVQGWMSRHGDIFLTLFLVPFVLVGLGTLIAIPVVARTLWLPRVELTLERSPLGIGETALLRWQLIGDSPRLQRLQIRSAIFDVVQDDSRPGSLQSLEPVWSQDLLDTVRRTEMQSGRLNITIGEPVPPHDRFKRIWAVQVVYDLGKRKPMREVFPMRVIEVALIKDPVSGTVANQ